MQRLTIHSSFTYNAEGFAIAVIVRGNGGLKWQGGAIDVKKGETYFLPAGLSGVAWFNSDKQGILEVIYCFPPKTEGATGNKEKETDGAGENF